jgi:ABC-type lipoprotein release transport system permease subunit
MLWLKLGWRNLRRNRRRTAIELASISGSVFIALFFTSLAFGAYAQMIESGVRIGSGHIGIYARDYLRLRRVEQTFPVGELEKRLLEVPNVRAVFTRLYVPGLIRSSRSSSAAVFIGIDFPAEGNYNPVLARSRLVKGGIPGPGFTNGAVIGKTLAGELNLEVGNKFVLMTQGPGGEISSDLFRVSGIIRTGIREFDSGTVIVPRERLARMIGKEGSAHEAAVLLGSVRDIPRALPEVRDIVRSAPGAEAYDWKHAMPSLEDTIRLDRTSLFITVIFLYLIVGIGTINTLLMSVMERTREFGVIRALGVRKSGVLRMVCAEAFVLAVTGVALGVALFVLVGLYTSTKGIDVSSLLKVGGIAGTLIEPIIYTAWSIPAIAAFGGGMVALALAASLYPAYHVIRIRPSEAMRKH